MRSLRRPVRVACASLLSLAASGVVHAQPTAMHRAIRIDGNFEDWADAAPITRGAALARGNFLVLGDAWGAFDNEWLYLSFETNRPVNLQGLGEGTLILQFDADGNPLTGVTTPPIDDVRGVPGVDFELRLSPYVEGEFKGAGAAYLEAGMPPIPVNPYALQTVFAPTYADTRFELRLRRGVRFPGSGVAAFAGDRVSGKLVFVDAAGTVLEQSWPFEMALTALDPAAVESINRPGPRPDVVAGPDAAEATAFAGGTPGVETGEPRWLPSRDVVWTSDQQSESTGVAAPAQRSAPALEHTAGVPVPAVQPTWTSMRILGDGATVAIGKTDPRAVRFVTWNVERGSLFENPGPFERILRALSPDVLALQELGDEATTATLRDWLNTHVPDPYGWEVTVDAEAGVGIASRLSMVPTALNRMPTIGEGGPALRATTALVATSQGRVAVVSTHLKCCGVAGDESDQRRQGEALAIHQLLRRIRHDENPRAVVVLGDFNLVGSRLPLDTVMGDNDLDATDLLDVAPMVLGDTTNITWYDPGQPFLPGRLDFALVSDSTLKAQRGFVLNTMRLDPATLTAYHLQTNDSLIASDHLPVVVDVR